MKNTQELVKASQEVALLTVRIHLIGKLSLKDTEEVMTEVYKSLKLKYEPRT